MASQSSHAESELVASAVCFQPVTPAYSSILMETHNSHQNSGNTDSQAAANQTKSSAFIPVDDDCSQIPFWFLNGAVDGDEWARQIREMAGRGVFQAMPHPRFGMDRRAYLEEPYWNAFGKLLEAAEKDGFTIHLYDEYNWSSGPAGGRVTANAKNCALGLGIRSQVLEGPSTAVFSEWTKGLEEWGLREAYLVGILCPVDIACDSAAPKLNLEKCVEIPLPSNECESVPLTVPEGRWIAMVFYIIRTIHPSPLQHGNGGIIDYLAKEPTREFIQLTHEEYYKRFSHHFGKTVKSVFYDESGPYASGPFSWTACFAEEFLKRKGYDLIPLLPCLFFDCGDLTEKCRCDYWDLVSDLFVENHIAPMADWAAAHGINLTGHTHEAPWGWRTGADCMRTLRRQQWSGLDTLGGYNSYGDIKAAASVPHLKGSRTLLCEAFGTQASWQYSPRLGLEAYNQLGILGVTHQVPHAFFQTVDSPKVECPPSFFEHNPYWKYYSQLADLASRHCWMARQGHHSADIAVLYPLVSWQGISEGGRGYNFPWASTAASETEAALQERHSYEKIINLLMANQMDLDVIDSQALTEAKVAGKSFSIAEESYQAVILPPMTVCKSSDIERLLELAKAGIKIIAVGSWPAISMERGRNDKHLALLLEELKERGGFANGPEQLPKMIRQSLDVDVLVLEGVGPETEISHWKIGHADSYTVSNRSNSKRSIKLSFRTTQTPVTFISSWDGRQRSIASHIIANRTEVQLDLFPMELGYVILGNIALARSSGTAKASTTAVKPWPRAFVAGEDAIKLEGKWSVVPAPARLDKEWSIDIEEMELKVPVFKSKELDIYASSPDAALWRKWFKRDFDDSSWETVHCLRSPLLYSCAGSRLFRTEIPFCASAIKLPLPVAGEYVVYINGAKVNLDITSGGWLDLGQFGCAGEPGVIAIETSSMAPEFGLTGPLTFRCTPTSSNLGSWTKKGLWWFAGRSIYKKSFTLPRSNGRSIILDLGEVRECAEIWINGSLAGVRLWPPYCLDITEFTHLGENEVAVVASNLLSNRFAWDDWGTRGSGKTLDSGLIGPVVVSL